MTIYHIQSMPHTDYGSLIDQYYIHSQELQKIIESSPENPVSDDLPETEFRGPANLQIITTNAWFRSR